MTGTSTPVSEILYTAADLIERRGWGGAWGSTNENAPVCLEGGILAAIGAHLDSGELWVCPAYAAVQSYLGIDSTRRMSVTSCPEGGFELWRWNDAPGRTQAEVIATLRACAVIEAAKEQAAVDTPAVSVAPVRSGL